MNLYYSLILSLKNISLNIHNKLTKNIFLKKYFFFSFNGIFLQINRLIQTAILVRVLDESNFAVWIYVLSLVSFFTILDFGIPTYLGNKLVIFKKYKDKFISSLKKLFFFELLIILIILILSILTFLFSHIYESLNLKISNSPYFITYFSFIVLILAQVISSFNFIIYRSLEKQSYYLNISNLVYFVQTIFLLYGYINNNLAILAILFTAPVFLQGIYFHVLILNKFKIKFFTISKFSLEDIKGSFYMSLVTFANLVFINIPIIFLNKNYSNTVLIIFFLYKTISNGIITILKYLPSSLWTNITHLNSNKDFQLLIKMNKLNNYILVFLLFVFIVFGELIVNIWTGNTYQFNKLMFFYLLIYGVIKSTCIIQSIYFQSTNILKSFSIIYFISSLLLIFPFFFKDIFPEVFNYLIFLIIIELIVSILCNILFIKEIKVMDLLVKFYSHTIISIFIIILSLLFFYK